MQRKRIKRVGLFVKSKSERALRTRVVLENFLKTQNIKYFVAVSNKKIKKMDLAIVLGGDGTLLSVVSKLEFQIPILGINLGDFGFMTELNVSELFPTLKDILRGKYCVDNRILLEVEVRDTTKSTSKKYNVLNEVAVHNKWTSRMVSLETYIDREYVMTVQGDGLIVATPTGSTAYSLAAGGPIVTPTTNSITLTPICPHTLTHRPLIIPNSSHIEIRLPSKKQNIMATFDGQQNQVLSQHHVLYIRKSKRIVSLIKSPLRTYFDILRTKLYLGYRGSKKNKRVLKN
ncbi:MAG: NAD(+)/NADH kinase [Deltaproteobacteria bacterium]|nr:NAD(+)/NADH kinase [Deltaproteobacteria bacterium]